MDGHSISAAGRLVTGLAVLSISWANASLEAESPPPPEVQGAQAPSVAAEAGANLDTTFTYQGRIASGGVPVEGTCDFVFRLFNDSLIGLQVGPTLNVTADVVSGLFTVSLAFGPNVHRGTELWLDVRAACPSGATPVQLLPRQRLSSAPSALTLMPGAEVTADWYNPLLHIENTSTTWGSAATFYNHDASAARPTLSSENYGTGAAGQFVSSQGFAAAKMESDSGVAVDATSESNTAVYAVHHAGSGTAAAVYGLTYSGDSNATAVYGEVGANAGSGSAAVKGHSYGAGTVGYGVYGVHQAGGTGVYGTSVTGRGVSGYASSSGVGVQGQSSTGPGVYATTGGAGIGNPAVKAIATRTGAAPSGIALYAENRSGDATIVTRNTGAGDVFRAMDPSATSFVFSISGTGTVRADGSYNCGLSSGCFNTGSGADLAERIEAGERLEPGDVVEIDPERLGHYRRVRSARSRLVAGVISTSPAITMNNNDLEDVSAERTDDRPLIALVGVVPVRVSAENGAIEPGDLLVSAAVEGHAMRAGEDPRLGTVIGKALGRLDNGTGTVPMLVMLR